MLVNSLKGDVRKISTFKKYNFNIEKFIAERELNLDERFILYSVLVYTIYGDSMSAISIRRILELITLNSDIYINKYIRNENINDTLKNALKNELNFFELLSSFDFNILFSKEYSVTKLENKKIDFYNIYTNHINNIMKGKTEDSGKCIITKAFNLPSKYILHTVGPIIQNSVSKKDEELLYNCYKSCLETAKENNIKSIAFCCISTGEFKFPNKEASQIAVNAVKDFLNNSKYDMKILFNVFKDLDYELYYDILK